MTKREKKTQKNGVKLINQKEKEKTMAVNQAIRSIGNGREKHNKIFVFSLKKKKKRTGQDRWNIIGIYNNN